LIAVNDNPIPAKNEQYGGAFAVFAGFEII
jgi:hypothetical protein